MFDAKRSFCSIFSCLLLTALLPTKFSWGQFTFGGSGTVADPAWVQHVDGSGEGYYNERGQDINDVPDIAFAKHQIELGFQWVNAVDQNGNIQIRKHDFSGTGHYSEKTQSRPAHRTKVEEEVYEVETFNRLPDDAVWQPNGMHFLMEATHPDFPLDFTVGQLSGDWIRYASLDGGNTAENVVDDAFAFYYVLPDLYDNDTGEVVYPDGEDSGDSEEGIPEDVCSGEVGPVEVIGLQSIGDDDGPLGRPLLHLPVIATESDRGEWYHSVSRSLSPNTVIPGLSGFNGNESGDFFEDLDIDFNLVDFDAYDSKVGWAFVVTHVYQLFEKRNEFITAPVSFLEPFNEWTQDYIFEGFPEA